MVPQQRQPGETHYATCTYREHHFTYRYSVRDDVQDICLQELVERALVDEDLSQPLIRVNMQLTPYVAVHDLWFVKTGIRSVEILLLGRFHTDQIRDQYLDVHIADQRICDRLISLDECYLYHPESQQAVENRIEYVRLLSQHSQATGTQAYWSRLHEHLIDVVKTL